MALKRSRVQIPHSPHPILAKRKVPSSIFSNIFLAQTLQEPPFLQTMKPSPKKRYPRYRKPEEPYRVNRKITAPEIRLVGTNKESDIYPLSTALDMASQQGLDLVEVAPNTFPPVCRIIDYAKFKYEKKKKAKEIKAKASKNLKKEIKLTLRTDQHDLSFKKKHAIKFLQEGATVQVLLQFKGRELQDKDQGKIALQKFFEQLAPHGALQKSPPTIVGRRCIMMLELDKKRK